MFKVGEEGWYKLSDRSDTERFGKVIEIKQYRDFGGIYFIATIQFEDGSRAFLKETK